MKDVHYEWKTAVSKFLAGTLYGLRDDRRLSVIFCIEIDVAVRIAPAGAGCPGSEEERRGFGKVTAQRFTDDRPLGWCHVR